MNRMRHKNTMRTIVFALCIIFTLYNNSFGETETADETERATVLQKALVNLYFYPINRLLDIQDVFHFGIAGTVGLGAEVAATENASFGAYYTAKEAGIAFHGHRKRLSWLDAPPAPVSPIKLIPGLDENQRKHSVENGYATASFGNLRYETESDEKLHFKRYTKQGVLNRLVAREYEEDTSGLFMDKMNESLHEQNESAIRAEVVAGIVHPYAALELNELLDFTTGLFFLDLKDDDWETEPGRNKLRKLGRGVANVITGFVEVPLNVIEVDGNEGGFAALSYGTVRGFWRFFVRSAVVGPWEIVTFPTDTESIIEPEFPFTTPTSEISWRIKYK